MKLFIEADVPLELSKNFLQHIRDFDTKNKGCHFKIGANVPDLTTDEAYELMKIDPKLEFVVIIDKDQG